MAINQAARQEFDGLELEHLVDLVRQRARQHPDRPAYIYLADGEHEHGRLTFDQLDRRSAALAAHLQARGLAGERALLVYDPGLDYIIAFYACLYAGVIAVPVYPPDPLRFNRVLPRLMSILEQADARVVLSSAEILSWSRQFFVKSAHIEHVLATDELAATGDEGQWAPPAIGSESIAFLQYTSGSCGDPKGVVLTHGNLLANLDQMGRMHHEGASAVLWLPPYHDMGLIGGILLLAYRGCPMVLMPPLAFVQRPARWLEAISRYGATSSGSPNFGYELCVKKIDPAECAGLDLSTWRLACNGSEPIRAETLERFYEKFAPYGLRRETFCPCYGMAEATLMVSCAPLEQAPVVRVFDAAELENHRVRLAEDRCAQPRALVSSGRPVDHEQVLIVDPHTLTPCASGEVGEIWASGPNIAQGYWNRPEQSEAAFAAHLAGEDDASFLRTGDLGFMLDGELFVTGRIKDLIIVAGRNHYPQDIERTVEETHAALKHDGGAVFSLDIDGEERVVVVQEVLRPRRLDLVELTQHVRAAVAEVHELPLHAVVLIQSGSMPKTSSGKVQRHACKQMFLAGELLVLAQWRADEPVQPAEPDSTDTALQTHTEEVLGGLWSEVLGVEQPDRRDDFFAQGGQSLLVTQLMARIADVCGVELPLRTLFEAPTLAALAQRIDAAAAHRAGSNNGNGHVLSGATSQTVHDPIVPVARDGLLPLSFAQQRLWFLDQLEPGNPFYNLPTAARLNGPLDVAALRSTLDELVRRHESLRSVFRAVEGQPRLEIMPPSAVELAEVDLRGDDAAARQQQLQRHMALESRKPFDLAQGPLLRAVLLRLAEDEHVLLVCMHHIVADGWSLGVLVAEMSAIYDALRFGRESPLPTLTLQHVDYAVWQRDHLKGPRLEQQLNYWRKQLVGLPPELELPADRPRPAKPTFAGALASRLLDCELTNKLDEASRASGTTTFMFLLAALDTLLHRYTGSDDLVVGTPIAGRSRRELEPLVGFFANMLVLRTDASGNPTFRELLGRVKQTTLDAYTHQDVPFEKLVGELEPNRCLHRSPLFQVALVLQNSLPPQAADAPLHVEPLLVDNGTAKYDLTIYCWPRPTGLELVAEYSTERFEPATIARLLDSFQSVLAAATSQPELRLSELPVMGEADRQRLLEQGAGPAPAPPEWILPQRFAEQAAATPEAIAVTDSRGSLTYRVLDRRSNQLARYLQHLGVGPDTLVGLCVDRSSDMLVGLLGILKAGGAYVPLDPAYPAQRLAHMLSDAQVGVLVTQTDLLGRLPPHEAEEVLLDADWQNIDRESDGPVVSTTSPDHLAYTIYTSGSTGQPKGVEITHAALANFLASFREEPGLAVDDILVAVTTLSFDIAALELFLPLVVGAQVVIAPREIAVDGRALAELLEQSHATVMQATPATWRLLLEAGWRPERPLKILCGGEALTPALAAQLAERSDSIWNVYGPTETTIWSTVYKVRSIDSLASFNAVPLGRPIANTELLVLDGNQNLVPIGVPGELHIGGLGLARGYRNLPELTQQRFVPHPFSRVPSARLYRTGDQARWLVDGTLEFLGRIDHQVKLRGHRIELGEIESLLARHPAVQEAAVVLRHDAGDEPRLVAYYSLAGEEPIERSQLSAWLKQHLPDYMLPAAFVRMDCLPRTPNGKLDRRQLPAPERQAAEPGGDFVPPASATEQTLADIWRQLLAIDRVGRHDHFFDLGGHSLLATQLVSRIRNLWDFDLPLRAIFEAPVLCELAERVDADRRKASSSAQSLPPLVRVDRNQRLPLSFAQQRLWFLDQMEPGNPVYVLPAAARLTGPLDRELFARSLDAVVERHEGLRTIFPQHDGQSEQRILPAAKLELAQVDLQQLPANEREAELQRQMRAAAREPFDLARGPLVRATLYCLGEREHVLLLVMHHIVADGWSLGVLLGDVASSYRALQANEPLPQAADIQYADFAAWQTQFLEGTALAEQMAWWQEQLAELPPPLDLPADFPRPVAPQFTGGVVTRELSPELAVALHAAGRSEGATFFMVLLAGFEALLARYSGQTRFCVGTPIANRTRSELESLVGFFANTLVLPADLGGNPTFREHLQRVKQSTLGAFAHQDVPLEKLVEALSPERSRNRAPLFQVALVLQNAPLPLEQPDGLRVEPLVVDNGTAKYDLTLFCSQHHGRLLITAEYSTELFESSTIERMLAAFERLLAAAASDPGLHLGQLPLLSAADEEHLLHEFNDTQREFPRDQTLCGLLADAAQRFADLPAIVGEHQSLTYRELDGRVRQMTSWLQGLGIEPGSRVALCAQRSPEMLIGMLAVLKAGAAYVPLDPAWPAARVGQLIADARCGALITQAALVDRLPRLEIPLLVLDDDAPSTAELPQLKPDAADPDSPAYVIYTSGSTGQPKGVEVSHRALVNHACHLAERMGLAPGQRVLQFISPSFDASAEEIFPALASGATLVLYPNSLGPAGSALAAFCQRQRIDVWHLPTAVWKQVVDELSSRGETLAAPPRVLLVGGESASYRTLEKWRTLVGGQGRFLHAYGLTEAAVTSTLWEASLEELPPMPGDWLPIGRPIANTRAFVLDRFGQPSPLGVAGELFIGGVGLARGYVGNPDLTAQRFVINPLARVSMNGYGGRFYRTGDRVRWLADGNLEFLGRTDQQIKFHGLRIEPGEIECALQSHPGVRDARVVLRDAAAGEQLVAYVVPADNEGPSPLAGDVETEQVVHWQSIFEDTYRGNTEEADPTLNLVGWNSSYTGQPIPADEMREWLDRTVETVAALRPDGFDRVLEIGCGTGMVLFRVAPQAREYWATDFSQASLDHIERALAAMPDRPAVTLRHQPADDFSGLAEASVDLVILNSVVQYFPSADYLARVLSGIARLLKPGGAIFLGDVRSNSLLAAFHASVELAHAADDLPRALLRERIARRIDQEQELCVAPSMFAAWAAEHSSEVHVEARLKRGVHTNELTRFRYDVVLRAESTKSQEPQPVRWPADCLNLDWLRDELRGQRPAQLVISGVPNSRVLADALAWKLACDESGPVTTGELRAELATLRQSAGIDPEAFWALADECGYRATIRWSEADEQGAFDVVLERRDAPAAKSKAAGGAENNHARRRHAAWNRYTTDPVRGLLWARLVPALRQRLENRLPAAWIPSAFVLLDSLPLTTGGKLDRRALPEPTGSRPQWSGPLVAPRNEFEAKLVSIWETLLGVRPVGVHDSFFDLGGHSMLAVKMVAEIDQSCGRQLPLNVLFQRPTVAELAELLARPALADANSSLVPIQITGQQAPLFLIHPAGGTVFCYRELCLALGSEQPVYGLQAQGLDGRHAPLARIEDMAAHYIRNLRQVQPRGPYQLCGWSLGGNIAYEMACQLHEQGDEVRLLALIDAGAQAPDRQAGEADFLAMLAGLFPDQQQMPLEKLRQMTVAEQLDYFVERASQAQLIGGDLDLRTSARPVFEVFQANVQAIATYQPRPYAGRVTLLKAAQQAVEFPSDDILGWRSYLTGPIDVHAIPGNHVHMLNEPNVQHVASVLSECLRAMR